MSNNLSAKKPIALVLAASLASVTMMPVTTASAHDTYHYHTHEHVHHHHRERRSNDGDLIAAGIIGLAVGAIIADSANRSYQPRATYVERAPRYRPAPAYRPAPTYYNERRSLDSYNEPHVVRLEDDLSLEPWSPGWYEWCDNRYRSFNARTGTFRGYDGLDHFCVPK